MSLEEEINQKYLETRSKLTPENQIYFEIWMHAYISMISNQKEQVSKNKIVKYVNGKKKYFTQYEILIG